MLIAGQLSWKPAFGTRPVHVAFTVDKVALVAILFPILQFCPVSIIPPLLYTHITDATQPQQSTAMLKKYFFLFCTDILYRQTAGPIRGTPAVSHCRIDCLFARHLHGKSRNFCVAISGICAEIRDRNLMNRKQKG